MVHAMTYTFKHTLAESCKYNVIYCSTQMSGECLFTATINSSICLPCKSNWYECELKIIGSNQACYFPRISFRENLFLKHKTLM